MRQFSVNDTDEWLDRFGSGADGAYTTGGNITDSSRSGYGVTTFSGTQGGTSATAGSGAAFSVGDIVLIHQSRNGGDGAGVWELNKISSKGSGTDWTMAYDLQNDYGTTAQVYRLPQYTDVTINHTLTGVDWAGSSGGIVAFLCNGAFSGSGTIDLNGKGYIGGIGDSGTDASGRQGEGTSGASGSISSSANGNGGGGVAGTGTGDGGASGGGGGNGFEGGDGRSGQQKTPGVGGGTGGNEELTVMVFGGGGGGSGAGRNGQNNGGNGGNGGGLLIIIARNIDLSSMTIVRANGTNGTNQSANSAGGSGGAGGSILLKGQTINMGSSKIQAHGGNGGSGGNGTGGGAGGTTGAGTDASSTGSAGTGRPGAGGGAGRIRAEYSVSLSGTTNPSVSSAQDTIFNDPSAGGSPIFFAAGF